jgi:hypothetical protein
VKNKSVGLFLYFRKKISSRRIGNGYYQIRIEKDSKK